MALRRVKCLNAADGYLRWKESMLLALHTAGVAHVLASGGHDGAPATADVVVAKQWARNDAICRGQILAALSNRLLPDYVHHATARALWAAVACTYDVNPPSMRGGGSPSSGSTPASRSWGQIAHAEALGVAGHTTLSDGVLCAACSARNCR